MDWAPITDYRAFLIAQGTVLGLRFMRVLTLSEVTTHRLATGMCFSNEPMIVVPGQYGIRLEDHFYMTDTGAQMVYRTTKQSLSTTLRQTLEVVGLPLWTSSVLQANWLLINAKHIKK